MSIALVIFLPLRELDFLFKGGLKAQCMHLALG